MVRPGFLGISTGYLPIGNRDILAARFAQFLAWALKLKSYNTFGNTLDL